METVVSILWSVTKGALLTAAVLVLLRLVFHKALSAKAKYYLWLLLALRLMLPVLPESPLSLLNFLPVSNVESESPVVEAEGNLPIAANDPVWLEQAPAEDLPAKQAGTTPTATDAAPAGSGAAEEIPVSEPDKTPITTILFWVWLGGMGLVLLVQAALYLITARQLRQLPYCADSDTLREFLKLKKSLHIKKGPQLKSGGAGMLGGLLRTTLVLPAERRGEDAAPVLLHELLHYKYLDLYISALWRLLCAVYWFNPAVWLCFFWSNNDAETACDQRVLETGLVAPSQYASTLYKEGVLHVKKNILPQTTFGGRRHSLKRRIQAIAAFRKPKFWVILLSAVLALTVGACTLTGASGGEENDIETALVNAEETILALGSYESETCDTASLSKAELQDQIDAYNADIDRCFAAGSTYLSYKTEHERLLREVYSTPNTYRTDGGVLSWAVESCNENGDTAEITADMVTYNTWVEFQDGQYPITCVANKIKVTAEMVREDGGWKVKAFTEDNHYEDWTPGGSVDSLRFDNFSDALAAAREIDVAALCPLKAGEETKAETGSTVLKPTGGTMTTLGSVLPCIQYDGRYFYWRGLAQNLDQGEIADWIEYASGKMTVLPKGFEAAGELNCVYYDEPTEDFDIAIGGGATGTVYVNSEQPEVLYVLLYSDTTDGLYVRFTTDRLGNSDRIAYGGQLYELAGWDNVTVLPDGYRSVGELTAVGCDNLPQRDLETNEYFGQKAVYVKEGDQAYIYIDSAMPSQEGQPEGYFRCPLLVFDSRGIAMDVDLSALEPAPAAAAPSYSPYALTADTITFGNTRWGMTIDEVFAAENLDEDVYTYQRSKNFISSGASPLPDHPEVTNIKYSFNFVGPELENGLTMTEIQYDNTQISFEALQNAWTEKLGEPSYADEEKAHWYADDGTFLMLMDTSGAITEKLRSENAISAAQESSLQNLDVSAYMESLQPPNGRFGCTLEEHFEAGLLSREDGTVENAEADDGSPGQYFHTTVELGGYELPIAYYFHATLVSEEMVLTQVFVTLPEDVDVREWVESFQEPWKNKLIESSDLYYVSPVMLSSLLPQETQRELVEKINEVENSDDGTLTNWSLVWYGYLPSGHIWQFNGTGAALYLTAAGGD